MAYQFDVYDYIVLSFVLAISIVVGLYHALVAKYGSLRNVFKRKNSFNGKFDLENTVNYLTASGSMSAIPIAFSLIASFFSATSLLGLPAEVYQYGIEYWMISFGIMFTPLIGCFITGPMFARLKVASVFEYLKLRYNSNFIRLVATGCYVISFIITVAIYIYGPSTTITALTTLSSQSAIILVGGVATFYTTIGGIKAVIWTDVIQLTVMFAGVVAVLIKGTLDVGGLGEVWRINSEGGRLNFFDFNPDPFIRQSFWSLTVGMFFFYLLSYSIDQQLLQRFSAAKSTRQAKIALLLNIPIIFVLISLCCFSGLVIYANYANCDPLSAPQITNVRNVNQMLVYLVTDKMKFLKGFTGLFVSSILSGALSSVSSSLNSMAAVLWEDYFKQFKYFRNLNDTRATLVIKVLVIACGFISSGFAILISTLGGNLYQIGSSLIGAMNAPIVGVFFLAGLVPFSNVIGAFVGIIIGFAFGFWLSYGAFVIKPVYHALVVNDSCYFNHTGFNSSSHLSNLTYGLKLDKYATNLYDFNKFYGLSYAWYTTSGVLVTLTAGIGISLLTCGWRNVAKREYTFFYSNKNTPKETQIIDSEKL